MKIYIAKIREKILVKATEDKYFFDDKVFGIWKQIPRFLEGQSESAKSPKDIDRDGSF